MVAACTLPPPEQNSYGIESPVAGAVQSIKFKDLDGPVSADAHNDNANLVGGSSRPIVLVMPRAMNATWQHFTERQHSNGPGGDCRCLKHQELALLPGSIKAQAHDPAIVLTICRRSCSAMP